MARKRKRARKAGKKRTFRETEAKLVHAVGHPVRLDILSILFVRIASREQLATMLRKPLSMVGYHLRQLQADHVIEVVGEERQRRSVERYYRATVRPELSDEELEALPRAARRRLAAVALQAIVTEGLSSLRHGQMDGDDELGLACFPVRLSRQGRDEVNELRSEALKRLEAIVERDANRAKDDSAPVRIAAIMWFERGHPAEWPGRLE